MSLNQGVLKDVIYKNRHDALLNSDFNNCEFILKSANALQSRAPYISYDGKKTTWSDKKYLFRSKIMGGYLKIYPIDQPGAYLSVNSAKKAWVPSASSTYRSTHLNINLDTWDGGSHAANIRISIKGALFIKSSGVSNVGENDNGVNNTTLTQNQTLQIVFTKLGSKLRYEYDKVYSTSEDFLFDCCNNNPMDEDYKNNCAKFKYTPGSTNCVRKLSDFCAKNPTLEKCKDVNTIKGSTAKALVQINRPPASSLSDGKNFSNLSPNAESQAAAHYTKTQEALSAANRTNSGYVREIMIKNQTLRSLTSSNRSDTSEARSIIAIVTDLKNKSAAIRKTIVTLKLEFDDARQKLAQVREMKKSYAEHLKSSTAKQNEITTLQNIRLAEIDAAYKKKQMEEMAALNKKKADDAARIAEESRIASEASKAEAEKARLEVIKKTEEAKEANRIVSELSKSVRSEEEKIKLSEQIKKTKTANIVLANSLKEEDEKNLKAVLDSKEATKTANMSRIITARSDATQNEKDNADAKAKSISEAKVKFYDNAREKAAADKIIKDEKAAEAKAVADAEAESAVVDKEKADKAQVEAEKAIKMVEKYKNNLDISDQQKNDLILDAKLKELNMVDAIQQYGMSNDKAAEYRRISNEAHAEAIDADAILHTAEEEYEKANIECNGVMCYLTKKNILIFVVVIFIAVAGFLVLKNKMSDDPQYFKTSTPESKINSRRSMSSY